MNKIYKKIGSNVAFNGILIALIAFFVVDIVLSLGCGVGKSDYVCSVIDSANRFVVLHFALVAGAFAIALASVKRKQTLKGHKPDKVLKSVIFAGLVVVVNWITFNL